MFAALVMALVTLAVVPARGMMSETVALLLLLMAVLINAAAFGIWLGLGSALTALAVFNFFFIEPHFSLMAARTQDIVVLLTFLAAAGLTGFLAGRLRDEVDRARDRARVLEVLSSASGSLARATSEEQILDGAIGHIAALSGAPVTALARREGLLVMARGSAAPHEADLQAAEQVLSRGRVEFAVAEGWTGSHLTFHPLPSGPGARHAIGHHPLTGAHQDTLYREQAITTVLHQAQAALERLVLSARADEDRQSSERQSLRAALLASLSHDLRTPLATILGSVTTLRDLRESLPPEAEADLIAAIAEEAERLARYVEKLLQMTRLVSGAAATLGPVDPADCARAATLRAQRAFAGAQIRAELPPLPLVMAEAGLVEQVIFSLIENAVRYAGGEIIVTGEAVPGLVRLAVQDRGPGLPERVTAWLPSPALTRGEEDAGLGLPICKGIARLLGGRLEACEAGSDGQGSLIALVLPVPAREVVV